MRILGHASASVALAFAIALSAFAGTREIKDPNGAFSLELPADWKPEVKNGKIESNVGGASVFVSSKPRRRKSVEQMADEAAAASSAVARDLNGSWREEGRAPVKLGGVDGLRVRATRDNGIAKDIEDNYFALLRDHEIDLQFVAPKDEFPRLEKAFQAVIASVQIPGDQVPPPAPPPQPEPKPTLPPPPMPQPIPPQPIAPTPAPQPQPPTLPQLIPPPAPLTPAQPGPPKDVADTDGLFTFTVPGDWMAFSAGAGNASAYSPGAKASISVMSWSKIALSFDQLAQGYVAGHRLSPNVKFLANDSGQVAGHRAMRFLTEGDLVGNPVRTDCYFIDGDRHVFNVTLVCGKDDYARLQPVFAQIVANLRFNVRPPQPEPQLPPGSFQPFPTPQPFPQPQPMVPFPTPPTPQPLPFPTPLPMPGVPQPAQGILRQVSDAEGLFSFSVPAGWQVQQQARGAAAVDAARPANVAARVDPKQTQSLERLAQAAIALWQQQVPQWQEISRQTIQVSGRQALVIRASGAPGGVAVVGDHVLLLTDAWQAGLTLWCPQADFAQRQALFQQIIQSFQVR